MHVVVKEALCGEQLGQQQHHSTCLSLLGDVIANHTAHLLAYISRTAHAARFRLQVHNETALAQLRSLINQPSQIAMFVVLFKM
jgi:hypothetical protein